METYAESILLETIVTSVSDDRKRLAVSLEETERSERRAHFERVLVAVGRRPNPAIAGLDTTRANVNQRGFVEVDGQRRTSEPSLFAIGDVAGDPMLAQGAARSSRGRPGHTRQVVDFEPRAIPAVVFTDPELAWTGLTERTRRSRTFRSKSPSIHGRHPAATTLARPDGLRKLIIDPETERILGVRIVGVGAGKLISEGTLAIEMGALASDLKLTIHSHPTLSETVMEAADVYFGESAHVYKPKKT